MSSKPERQFSEAVSLFQARDLAGSERLCGEVLRRSPRHAGALHLLGLVRLAGGNAREAVALLERAVQRDPHNPIALENLGVAHLAAGDAAAAEPPFRRALGLGAAHATLPMRLGLALLAQRRLPEAVAALRSAAAKAPGDPEMLLNLGNALAEGGAAEEALACYREVLAVFPHRADAHFNLGTQLRRMGRVREAASAYQAALAADPRYADAYHNLGLIHQQEGRLDEAASCYRRALDVDRRHIHARNNLGNVLMAQGLMDEAEAQYRGALDDRPDYSDAYVNLGNLRIEQGRYGEAQALYERALALDPASYDVQHNLGDALLAQGRLDDAAASYRRSLESNPRFASAQHNLGLVHLYRREFGAGWPGYERRKEVPDLRARLRKDPATVDLFETLPHWRERGEAVTGEVAIWAEQGIGDQVLFSTLVPELIESGLDVVYEVDGRLLGAYERAFPGARLVALADPPHAALRGANRSLLAGSLPGLFRTTPESFAAQPAKLLAARGDRVAHYRHRLASAGEGPKVAISWRSARKNHLGPTKSARLSDFAPVLKLPGVLFHDVQYGDTAGERRAVEEAVGVRLTRFDEVDYYNDLEELLAILEASDLVITTSNATAHFAGALGKRTWLLYLADHPPFFYWAHGGDYRCLWYPSVEIVTAATLIDWPSLLRHAADKLRSMTAENASMPVSGGR
jgi:tetratricopeptide (TPR) repeat protein